jgi:hypothetical protein
MHVEAMLPQINSHIKDVRAIHNVLHIDLPNAGFVELTPPNWFVHEEMAVRFRCNTITKAEPGELINQYGQEITLEQFRTDIAEPVVSILRDAPLSWEHEISYTVRDNLTYDVGLLDPLSGSPDTCAARSSPSHT